MKITILENEYWYGLNTTLGTKMPFHQQTEAAYDFSENTTPNQGMPFLVSTKGRYIWSEKGFPINFSGGTITVPNEVTLADGFSSLKEAYLQAMKTHFPFAEHTPAENLFKKIIYNTWIELTFYQNQDDILKYAETILANGMPAGVLMIDDGWSNYYGDWTFHKGNFPEPKEMIQRLKELGFDLMLWICPFISADSVKYREAVREDILIKTPEGKTFITEWWNGFSAVLDMTNPKAAAWLKIQLDELQAMGIDGFKFDAGDSIYYREDNVTVAGATTDEQSQAWAKFGEAYAYNEYRVTFKAGGYPLLQRLCDKQHAWLEDGVASLIPDTLLQGITGHPYGSPDMIGGGEYLNFQAQSDRLDPELFVRHAEIASLLPAMQFSAAPYRVLDETYFTAIKNSIAHREKYLPYLLQLVKAVPTTGEPIVRYMAYEFPHEPVETLIDQFMLGERYLVAPIYEKGSSSRSVYLPKGKWIYDGETISSKGEKIEVTTEYGIPAVFEKVNS